MLSGISSSVGPAASGGARGRKMYLEPTTKTLNSTTGVITLTWSPGLSLKANLTWTPATSTNQPQTISAGATSYSLSGFTGSSAVTNYKFTLSFYDKSTPPVLTERQRTFTLQHAGALESPTVSATMTSSDSIRSIGMSNTGRYVFVTVYAPSSGRLTVYKSSDYGTTFSFFTTLPTSIYTGTFITLVSEQGKSFLMYRPALSTTTDTTTEFKTIYYLTKFNQMNSNLLVNSIRSACMTADGLFIYFTYLQTSTTTVKSASFGAFYGSITLVSADWSSCACSGSGKTVIFASASSLQISTNYGYTYTAVTIPTATLAKVYMNSYDNFYILRATDNVNTAVNYYTNTAKENSLFNLTIFSTTAGIGNMLTKTWSANEPSVAKTEGAVVVDRNYNFYYIGDNTNKLHVYNANFVSTQEITLSSDFLSTERILCVSDDGRYAAMVLNNQFGMLKMISDNNTITSFKSSVPTSAESSDPSTTVKLSWTTRLAAVRRVTISYGLYNQFPTNSYSSNAGTTSTIITGLTANTRYYFILRLYDESNENVIDMRYLYATACNLNSPGNMVHASGNLSFTTPRSYGDFIGFYTACSDTGQYVTLCSNDALYVSNDYGATWQTRGYTGINYFSIRMTGDGQIQVATSHGIPTNQILISEDYGETWFFWFSEFSNNTDRWYSSSVVKKFGADYYLYVTCGGTGGGDTLVTVNGANYKKLLVKIWIDCHMLGSVAYGMSKQAEADKQVIYSTDMRASTIASETVYAKLGVNNFFPTTISIGTKARITGDSQNILYVYNGTSTMTSAIRCKNTSATSTLWTAMNGPSGVSESFCTFEVRGSYLYATTSSTIYRASVSSTSLTWTSCATGYTNVIHSSVSTDGTIAYLLVYDTPAASLVGQMIKLSNLSFV